MQAMSLNRQGILLLRKCILQNNVIISNRQGIHRWVAPTLKELKRRREKIGEPKPAPRSSYLEWNYEAELYAFGKRLGENFKRDILKVALTNKSYVNKLQIQAENDPQNTEVVDSSNNNNELIERGDKLLKSCLTKTLSNKYPEFAAKAILAFLTTDDMLSYLGTHIGLKDIILTEEFPVENTTISNTFKAVLAALEDSSGADSVQKFVDDIVIAQMNGKEVFDVWEPENPYEYLKSLIKDKEIEPRLCNQSATNTLLANYQIGIYSNKKLLGIGWGETVHVAKNTAALNAIQRIYNI